MSKKVYMTVTGVIGLVTGAAEAVLAYTQPKWYGLWMALVPVVTKGIDELLLLWTEGSDAAETAEEIPELQGA